MSVHAGTIIHAAGNAVIDRIQSAGLGDVRVTNDVIREVGNELVVDKVPQDPSFTFTLSSFDTSTELEAMIQGRVATGTLPTEGPGAADPAGTAYKWSEAQYLNITSPWKDPTTGAAGVVTAGHIVPGYLPTRVRYTFGVSDNATQEVELSGGSFYYADGAPVEQFEEGDGTQTVFTADEDAIPYRIGGAQGTTFKGIFGVIVGGVLQTEGVDFTQTIAGGGGAASVTFTTPPGDGVVVKFAYFTSEDHAYPQAVHPDAVVKPGAVRGRNICIFVGTGGARTKIGGVQSFELEATVDGDFEREFCNEEVIGYTVNGRDCTGTLTARSKDANAFRDLMAKVTGVPANEVMGWLNTNTIPLEVQIQNPKNPGQILKTLYVEDAIFQPPGTPARVNTPTDFAFGWESRSGDYTVYKGAKP